MDRVDVVRVDELDVGDVIESHDEYRHMIVDMDDARSVFVIERGASTYEWTPDASQETVRVVTPDYYRGYA